jgi:N-acetylglucosamine kinase-like BadF-type ATPase
MNYKIGVYGDDAQTEYVLVDGAGQIRDRRTTIACNPNLFLDQDTIRSVMIEAMVELAAAGKSLHSGGRLAHTVLCMPGSQRFWQGIAARIPDFSPVSVLGTYVPALELATGGQPGLVLDCGRLRSFVAARGADGTVQCAGNFGWRMGDAGSNYDLGRRALIRTLLELQGWAASSELGRAAGAAMKSTDANVLAILLDAPPTSPASVADLAQHVFTLAAAGDEVANAIMRESVVELARLASTVQEKTFGRSASALVGLGGPLLQTAAAREALALALGENAKLVSITETPVEGLRRLLARL